MTIRWKWMLAGTLAFTLLITSVYIDAANKIITLELGIFSGSNWDVPNSESYEFFDEVIARFEKKYPGVKVKYRSGLRKKEYSNWISKQALKGDTPDVFLVPSEDFSIYSEVGLLKDLSQYAKDDKKFNSTVYYNASYNSGIYKDSLYALPFESVPTLMFVNKTLLEKEGIAIPDNEWTWEDFYRICKQITKDTNNDGRLDQFGVYDYGWREAAYSNDAELFSEAGTQANINTDELLQSVSFIQKMESLNENIVVTSQDFDEGKVAFCPMPFSQYRAYMPYPWRVKKYSTFEWDCIPLPRGENGDNTSQVETLSVGMSSTSSHKRLAWELLKMLSQDEKTQTNIFSKSQGVSVLKEVTQSEQAAKSIVEDSPGNSDFRIRVLNEVMEKGKVQPSFKNYTKAMEQIDNEIYRIINSNSDIHTQLATLQQNIESILKE